MQRTNEVAQFAVGQRAVTDTGRIVTILAVSDAFNMALVQFDNGGDATWWPYATLESVAAHQKTPAPDDQRDRWARALARILWGSEYEALPPVRRGACQDIARYSQRMMQAAR